MNKNNRKDKLFKDALKLFLLNQYDGVSLADIEEATGMTRGAIFYYAKSKEDLYKQVVQYFWIEIQKSTNKFNFGAGTLKDFIYAYTEGISKNMKFFQQLLPDIPKARISCAYLSFFMQLKEKLPELHDQYLINRQEELSMWHSIIERAKENGEIQSSINVFGLASQFLYLYYGVTFWDALDDGLNPDKLRRIYLGLYDMVKV